jgi:hypothetical protein
LENITFGSWGNEVGTKGSNFLIDFFPSLSIIKIPNPPPLIPIPRTIEVLDVDKGHGGSSPNPSIGFDLDEKDIHDFNPFEHMKLLISFLVKDMRKPGRDFSWEFEIPYSFLYR